MKTVLAVNHLSKSFAQTQVLNDVSLQVREGEFLAIMGRSGSGKSTLLYGISGMDRPTSGSVIFDEVDLCLQSDDQMSDIRLKKMGFIFQHSYLLKKLSVRDNIVLPGFKAGLLTREQVNQRAETLMAETGIAAVAGQDTKKVSGGQLQRAAICRALINQPQILFGDEPTGALNSSTSREVIEIINGVNRAGTTVILVTHDAKVAARAERIIFLVDGRIQAEMALGKYEAAEDHISREKMLTDWLDQQGL